MKESISLLLCTFILLSIFSTSLAIAEEESSGSDDENETDDSDNETEIETREKIRDALGNEIESEVKTRIVNGVMTEEIKVKIKLAEDRHRAILEFRAKLRMHNGTIEIENKNITIRELTDEQREIIAGKINARTGLNLTADDINGSLGSILRVYLSNGINAQVRFMPDRASIVALERLRAKCDATTNCTVELREVGSGNKTRPAYEVRTEKKSRVFLIFPARMAVQAHVDAETGEILSVKKPWWAFAANEEDASEIEIESSVSSDTDFSTDVNTEETEASASVNTDEQAEVNAEAQTDEDDVSANVNVNEISVSASG